MSHPYSQLLAAVKIPETQGLLTSFLAAGAVLGICAVLPEALDL
ncbi:hypothetical protein [Pontibacter qinzhouensis]|nr:hypothetical protein [Pontibacter qinzhouensis]